jgi:phage terminase small subunit
MKSNNKSLTIKQRKWMKEYIQTGNATEAAMRVYDCKNRNVANAIGSQNLVKLNVNELVEKNGLTDIALIRKLVVGMTQSSNRLSKRYLQYYEKETKVKEIEYENVPAYDMRFKYLELALKLKKFFVIKPQEEKKQRMKITQINYIGEGSSI